LNLPSQDSNYTSRVAWNNLLNSGKLKGMYLKVTTALYHNGECTAREIDAFNKKTGLWKRTNELRKVGLIEEAGKRACNVTGEVSVTWRLPKVPPEDFGSQVLYYLTRGVIGLKNHTWRGFKRTILIRRTTTVKAALTAEVKKHNSDAEFVTILEFEEVTRIDYDVSLRQQALTLEQITVSNMVVQSAHDVVDRLYRLPESIKAALDRHNVDDFDELIAVVNAARDDLEFVITEGKKVVRP
jgi:hypothetical protein